LDFKKICVLGLGYIGLPTACTFSINGVRVVGVDINHQVVSGLRNGQLHIQEPGLRSLVASALETGSLVVNHEPETADAFIIAVPTPFREDKRADLSYVISASESIVPFLRPGNLVVLESTSPPGTTQKVVAPILERSGLQAGKDFFLAYSPERVLPGQILQELIENARVIGGIDELSAQMGKDLYGIFVKGKIILTNAPTAEMIKLMENTYRDVNIAIANEFARLAERFGVNVWEAIDIANLHPRVNILKPGIGVGGHCISVDPWFLVEAAPDLTKLIHAARLVNDSQPEYFVHLIQRVVGNDLHGVNIALLGLAYKAGVDDMRESPAIHIAHLLNDNGASVAVYDPFKPGEEIEGLKSSASLAEAVQNAEMIIFLVGHPILVNLLPSELQDLTKARLIIDAVNGWTGKEWAESPFRIYHLGSVDFPRKSPGDAHR
jgi:UDP-N-acetyl-D-mannosaminuronic acid dehydrogenase